MFYLITSVERPKAIPIHRVSASICSCSAFYEYIYGQPILTWRVSSKSP